MKYFLLLVALLSGAAIVVNADDDLPLPQHCVNMPLIFVQSPFNGTFEKGKLVPLNGGSQMPTRMHAAEFKFTVVRVLTSSCSDQAGPALWTAVQLQILDVAHDDRIVFSHKFVEKDAISLNDLKDQHLIHALSYTNMPVAFSWQAKIRDVAENVVGMEDSDIMAYTVILPYSGKPGTFKIDFTPFIKTDMLLLHSLTSQNLLVDGDQRFLFDRKHLASQSFRGMFSRYVDESGRAFYRPSIPNAAMRKLHISYDPFFESALHNDFTLGYWAADGPRSWMHFSFYMYRPRGRRMWDWLVKFGLNAYLVSLDDGKEHFLAEFLDRRAPRLDHNIENDNSVCHDNPLSRRVIDTCSANKLAGQNPPDWANKAGADMKMEVAWASFRMKNLKHGDVVPYKFERQAGNVFAYALWIKFPFDFPAGRYQIKLKNTPVMAWSKNTARESYSDDFYVAKLSDIKTRCANCNEAAEEVAAAAERNRVNRLSKSSSAQNLVRSGGNDMARRLSGSYQRYSNPPAGSLSEALDAATASAVDSTSTKTTKKESIWAAMKHAPNIQLVSRPRASTGAARYVCPSDSSSVFKSRMAAYQAETGVEGVDEEKPGSGQRPLPWILSNRRNNFHFLRKEFDSFIDRSDQQLPAQVDIQIPQTASSACKLAAGLNSRDNSLLVMDLNFLGSLEILCPVDRICSFGVMERTDD